MPRTSSPQTRALLATFLEHPKDWRHGYDLSKQTGLKSGTMYPVLMRLSDLGYLEAAWREPEREGRPARHVYRLTSKGIAAAKEQLQQSPVRRGLKASAAEGLA